MEECSISGDGCYTVVNDDGIFKQRRRQQERSTAVFTRSKAHGRDTAKAVVSVVKLPSIRPSYSDAAKVGMVYANAPDPHGLRNVGTKIASAVEGKKRSKDVCRNRYEVTMSAYPKPPTLTECDTLPSLGNKLAKSLPVSGQSSGIVELLRPRFMEEERKTASRWDSLSAPRKRHVRDKDNTRGITQSPSKTHSTLSSPTISVWDGVMRATPHSDLDSPLPSLLRRGTPPVRFGRLRLPSEEGCYATVPPEKLEQSHLRKAKTASPSEEDKLERIRSYLKSTECRMQPQLTKSQKSSGQHTKPFCAVGGHNAADRFIRRENVLESDLKCSDLPTPMQHLAAPMAYPRPERNKRRKRSQVQTVKDHSLESRPPFVSGQSSQRQMEVLRRDNEAYAQPPSPNTAARAKRNQRWQWGVQRRQVETEQDESARMPWDLSQPHTTSLRQRQEQQEEQHRARQSAKHLLRKVRKPLPLLSDNGDASAASSVSCGSSPAQNPVSETLRHARALFYQGPSVYRGLTPIPEVENGKLREDGGPHKLDWASGSCTSTSEESTPGLGIGLRPPSSHFAMSTAASLREKYPTCAVSATGSRGETRRSERGRPKTSEVGTRPASVMPDQDYSSSSCPVSFKEFRKRQLVEIKVRLQQAKNVLAKAIARKRVNSIIDMASRIRLLSTKLKVLEMERRHLKPLQKVFESQALIEECVKEENFFESIKEISLRNPSKFRLQTERALSELDCIRNQWLEGTKIELNDVYVPIGGDDEAFDSDDDVVDFNRMEGHSKKKQVRWTGSTDLGAEDNAGNTQATKPSIKGRKQQHRRRRKKRSTRDGSKSASPALGSGRTSREKGTRSRSLSARGRKGSVFGSGSLRHPGELRQTKSLNLDSTSPAQVIQDLLAREMLTPADIPCDLSTTAGDTDQEQKPTPSSQSPATAPDESSGAKRKTQRTRPPNPWRKRRRSLPIANRFD